MRVDIDDKVLEDMMIVLLKDKIQDESLVVTNKVDRIIKKDNKTYWPIFLEKENPYEGYEVKVVHYMKNVLKYKGLGIENIEQYMALVKLRSQKIYGEDKIKAKHLQYYVKNRENCRKMGFETSYDFIEYRLIFDKYQDYDKTALEYSLQKDYETKSNYLKTKGIYSLTDYRKYNVMMKNALVVYDKANLKKEVSLEEFLEFELREFLWKKEYMMKTGSLKGIGKVIESLYLTPIKSPILQTFLYYKEPHYHFRKNGIRTFSEFYNHQKELVHLRHKYSSEKEEQEYLNYMIRNLRRKK